MATSNRALRHATSARAMLMPVDEFWATIQNEGQLQRHG